MLKILFLILISFGSLHADVRSPFESTKNLPEAYQGRFRSLDAASRLWLYDSYHKQQLKKSDLQFFGAKDVSALNLLWQIHFFGRSKWNASPFFWLHYASVKNLLKLDPALDHFSFDDLYDAIYADIETNLAVVKTLIAYEFSKQYPSVVQSSARNKLELKDLSKGLWISLQSNKLSIAKVPSTPPWNFLKPGVLFEDVEKTLITVEKNTAEELLQIIQQLHVFASYEGAKQTSQLAFEEFAEGMQKDGMQFSEISRILESRFPFNQRLRDAGLTLKMLPLKFSAGEWVSLHAFKVKTYDQQKNQLVLANNFTVFSDENFLQLRNGYIALEEAVLSNVDPKQIEAAAENFSHLYQKSYASISGTAYKKANGKFLSYPSENRLKAETFYYRLPLIEIALLAYALALILMLVGMKKNRLGKLALFVLLSGFFVHTAVLIFRCYILERPPVSNMFETVVYVPWIAIALGLIFYGFTSSRIIIAAAVLASFTLLVILKLSQVDSRLENVQAVLDSQYWLIIHVLMIVASYGAFVVCGILGHFYLIDYALNRRETASLDKIARGILHTMYVGVALLIPGTILGGVWAAESWGRFWDWDPKESWAFISACVYLLFIHAYTFGYIRDFGLALGSIAGLLAISFTWYGVNYILGTGFHSYGFGSGGEWMYFLYVAAECLFMLFMFGLRSRICKVS